MATNMATFSRKVAKNVAIEAFGNFCGTFFSKKVTVNVAAYMKPICSKIYL